MNDGAGIPGVDEPSGGGTGPPRRRRRILRWVGLAMALFVLAGAGAAWWLYRKLDANITADTTAAGELERYEKERPALVVRGAQNILLIGSDTRAGADNAKYGRDRGTQRSDTTILLHLAADGRSATAVSIPRDLMAAIPSCRTPDGTRTREQFAQFNWAFEFGGAACTIRTVENMTGIRIDHHMVVDFRGFKKMVDAIGGVEVCLKQPVDDAEAKLKLPAGRQTLHGEQALGFVRARYSLGNGSDTDRMGRQQQFLAALVTKVQSNGVLLNPAKLYPLLDAATSSLTTDPGLASLRDLYELVRGMREIPTDRTQFLTVPRQPYAANPNRDELLEPDASQLFRQLRLDKAVPLTAPKPSPSTEQATAGRSGEGPQTGADRGGEPNAGRSPSATVAGTPTPVPTFTGTTADNATCR
ncbi:LCP family protein [Streptomyces sp. NPDC089919]|uniref:LCP family protein n=1 Tax=Streptomyces sp. NPDC089919 TaxID=3155188 RepID=UPI00342C2EA4